jgi:hypothetical protein
MSLFPNIPGPEHTKRLALESDALRYIKLYGKDEAIKFLENKCKTCSIDDCRCGYKEIVEIIKQIIYEKD